MPKHTLSVLVENRPGVLARTTALFSRRGFNIESVSEGTTHDPQVSRITLVVNAEDRELEQVVKQIGKLVNVLKIVECDGDSAIRRGLVLVTVEADRHSRALVVDTAHLFDARVVDVAPDAVTLEGSGSPEDLQTMLHMLEQFGIRELVRSGTLAIRRASRSARPARALPLRPAQAESYPVSA
jgi:acetolactate synthase-1/3 small subunit